MATCSFDKFVRMYDFFSGDLLAEVSGHSDLITGVKFSPDGRSLYSIGGDGCIMVWDLAVDLVEAMQDRLLELYAVAQKKKAAVDEKALSIANIVADGDAASGSSGGGASRGVRTGGLSAVDPSLAGNRPVTSAAKLPSSSAQDSVTSQQRPATSSSEERVNKKLPASRMPAWAARATGEKAPEVEASVSSGVGGKWAARVDPGKGGMGGDRNKLTLEMTVEEATWRPPGSASPGAPSPASKLVDNMESSDDVLIGGDMDLLSNSSSDDEGIAVIGGDVDEVDDEDVLDKTSHDLEELQDSAAKLEDWLEKKVGLDTMW